MANQGRGRQRDKDGEFQSSQPTAQETNWRDRIKKFSDKYHEYHSSQHGQGQTKKNPLYDKRIDPMKRFEMYLASEHNEYGDDIDSAIAYAEKVFEEQGESIAGDWNQGNDEGSDNQSNTNQGSTKSDRNR